MSAVLKVKKSKIYGQGCFALAHFPARKKIATYAGELIKGENKIEARLRRQQAVAIKIIRLDLDTAIDGSVGGDATAYINHSCDPNAFMRIVPGQKVAIFARRDISPGEELTIDYRDP
ncbi:MAG TPA: SET domain-containing protein-lysine N-methyltransferase, partial [Pyrinomonadaceae bacterium]